jgi:hypothetical protein
VHADYRAVEQHLLKRHHDGQVTFSVLPMRNGDTANATLVMSAAEARDVAHVIATFKGLAIGGLRALDAELRRGLDRYVIPPDADGA